MRKKYDTVLTVRVDRRDLATAELILRKNQCVAANKGDLVRAGLEAMVKTYVERGEVSYVHSTEEAIHILSKYGNLNAGGKGQRNLTANLEKESALNEGMESFDQQVARGAAMFDQQQAEVEEEEKVSFEDV